MQEPHWSCTESALGLLRIRPDPDLHPGRIGPAPPPDRISHEKNFTSYLTENHPYPKHIKKKFHFPCYFFAIFATNYIGRYTIRT